MKERLFKSDEAAQLWGISRASVWSWAQKGLIRAGKTLGGDDQRGQLRITLEEINRVRKHLGLAELDLDAAVALLNEGTR